ncbi:hypothetical protein QTI17_21425 [Variovorax sp. J31P179]|uniref:hypothetical protein n=1 Tax=Variovorax sp. J31P179 TaxID=3053508 RepID=UPI002578A0A8|nr:hypothetical protein [Variovorax sp. J31P179]MDM0083161.1 hypothetical protein [Variovorax sp. J31P179]
MTAHAQIKRELGLSPANSCVATWNSKLDAYWLDIPTAKLSRHETFHIVLRGREHMLHLAIPTRALRREDFYCMESSHGVEILRLVLDAPTLVDRRGQARRDLTPYLVLSKGRVAERPTEGSGSASESAARTARPSSAVKQATTRVFDLRKAQHGVWHSVESRVRKKSGTLLAPGERVTSDSEVARLLGYGKAELIAHFDALLSASPEFNWRNKSGWAPIGARSWDIDHVLPVKGAKTFEEVLARSALSNLRPMWKHHNAAKGAFPHALAIGPRDELVAELKVVRAMLDDGSVESAKAALDGVLAGLGESHA